eukprot:g4016.t1
MGCPFGFTKKLTADEGANEFNELRESVGSLLKSCDASISAINACRERVINAKKGHCSPEMDNVQNCLESRANEMNAMFRICGNKQDGTGTSLRFVETSYRNCLKKKNEVSACLQPFRDFVKCANHGKWRKK